MLFGRGPKGASGVHHLIYCFQSAAAAYSKKQPTVLIAPASDEHYWCAGGKEETRI